MDAEARQRFVESWGAMGVAWGINRSMARIHALLMLADAPVSLDEIADTLEISRGNASMSLQKLAAWGVAHKVPVAADRRDFWASEADVWSMFFAIARERKRREFDPALAAVRERLGQLEALLGTGAQVLERFLANEQASRAVLAFLAAAPKL